jgi:hypothetical protein
MQDLLTRAEINELYELLNDDDAKNYNEIALNSDEVIYMYMYDKNYDIYYMENVNAQMLMNLFNKNIIIDTEYEDYLIEKYNRFVLFYSYEKSEVIHYMKKSYIELLERRSELKSLDIFFKEHPESLV